MNYGDDRTVEWNSLVLDYIRTHEIKNVILAARWQAFLNNPEGLNGLRATINELEKNEVHVRVIGQVPTQKRVWAPEIARAAFAGEQLPTGISDSEYREANQSFRACIDELLTDKVKYISVEPVCFNSHGKSRLADRSGNFYWDDDHLSEHGVRKLIGPLLHDCLRDFPHQAN